MPTIAFPDELKKAYWDKKKGALEGATGLEGLLKDLQKQHDALDWTKLAPGWAKGVTDAAKLKALYEALDKLYRTKASPLKLLATGVEGAADKAAKAKDAAKPLKEACAAIGKAAAVYAKAIAKGLDELEAELALAQKAVKPDEDEGSESEEDESSSALVNPKRLLKQLQMCKGDPARMVNFAYLDDGKQAPVLVLSPRLSGRAMMLKLVKDFGIKTGSFGMLSIADPVLKLVVEKKYSGLVKRIRIPIRECGFKLGKVLLLDEQGGTLDEDNEDEQPGVDQGQGSAPQKAAALPLADAMQAWAQARTDAITALKGAAKEIADLKDPESAKAVIEISAVVKNLTAEPKTPQQVAELVLYVDQDDVVLDVSEFAADIRTPLLKALAQLHRSVAA